MRRLEDRVVIEKNRKRAVWSAVMIALAMPVSGWFVYMGLRPGRAGVGVIMMLFGLMGVIAFAGYGILIVRTMRSAWRLELTREHATLITPAYDLRIPWMHVAGIGVGEVNHRLGCVLLFDDLPAVCQGACFRSMPGAMGAVTTASQMQRRLEHNLDRCGYHLGIPGRMLEINAEALAEMLTQGCTGALWTKNAP